MSAEIITRPHSAPGLRNSTTAGTPARQSGHGQSSRLQANRGSSRSDSKLGARKVTFSDELPKQNPSDLSKQNAKAKRMAAVANQSPEECHRSSLSSETAGPGRRSVAHLLTSNEVAKVRPQWSKMYDTGTTWSRDARF